MKSSTKKLFFLSGTLFLLFAIFTGFVVCFDVAPIGPEQTEVGFSTLNRFVFEHIGVHLIWYHITDWLGLAVLLFPLGFAVAGLYQLIKRRSLKKVDRPILTLGIFYLVALTFYLLFEQVVINYRPIILGKVPEASYPSSHTMMVVCVMATAATAFRTLLPLKKKLCFTVKLAAILLVIFTVLGRLISGVHWFTDIVGGVLLSAALSTLYRAVISCRWAK